MQRFPALDKPHREKTEAERLRDDERLRNQITNERVAACRALGDKLGKRYANARLFTFQAETPEQKKLVEQLNRYAANELWQDGTGILLYGPPGTGKDHLLAGLAYECILRGAKVTWVNGLDWYGQNRDRMETDRSEASGVRDLVTPEILYISDPLPPWGELSEYQASMLFRVIDGRYRACRATWVSANVANREECERRLGAATVDRLGESAVSAFCKWPSYRRGSK